MSPPSGALPRCCHQTPPVQHRRKWNREDSGHRFCTSHLGTPLAHLCLSSSLERLIIDSYALPSGEESIASARSCNDSEWRKGPPASPWWKRIEPSAYTDIRWAHQRGNCRGSLTHTFDRRPYLYPKRALSTGAIRKLLWFTRDSRL